MTAITRSASTAPESMSSTRPEASETCRMGTLRTSMGSAMELPFDDRDRWQDNGSSIRVAGGGGRDVGQRRDHRPGTAGLHETAGGLHLGPHRTAGEVPRGRVAAHVV